MKKNALIQLLESVDDECTDFDVGFFDRETSQTVGPVSGHRYTVEKFGDQPEKRELTLYIGYPPTNRD